MLSNQCYLRLHAFFDRSEKGYCTARLGVNNSMFIHYQLRKIEGSSNPPFKRLTIRRLDLCWAVLAAKLIQLNKTTYTWIRVNIEEVYSWTDFRLLWIRSSPHRWVTSIIGQAKSKIWYHHQSGVTFLHKKTQSIVGLFHKLVHIPIMFVRRGS